jgi:hypothetical protein
MMFHLHLCIRDSYLLCQKLSSTGPIRATADAARKGA